MLFNYLVVSYRNLLKNKGYTLINTISTLLTVGYQLYGASRANPIKALRTE